MVMDTRTGGSAAFVGGVVMRAGVGGLESVVCNPAAKSATSAPSASSVSMNATGGANNRRRFEFSSAASESAPRLKYSDEAQVEALIKFRADQQKKYVEDYAAIMHATASSATAASNPALTAAPAEADLIAQYMESQKRIAADSLDKKRQWEAQMEALKTKARPAPPPAPVRAPEPVEEDLGDVFEATADVPEAAVQVPPAPEADAEPTAVAETKSTSKKQASGIDIGSVMNKFIDDMRTSRKAQEDDIVNPRSLVSLSDTDIESGSDVDSSSDVESEGGAAKKKKRGKKSSRQGSKLENKGFGTKKGGEFDLVELAKSKKLKSLTIAKLQSISKQNNLSTEGKKKELVERLTNFLIGSESK